MIKKLKKSWEESERVFSREETAEMVLEIYAALSTDIHEYKRYKVGEGYYKITYPPNTSFLLGFLVEALFQSPEGLGLLSIVFRLTLADSDADMSS